MVFDDVGFMGPMNMGIVHGIEQPITIDINRGT